MTHVEDQHQRLTFDRDVINENSNLKLFLSHVDKGYKRVLINQREPLHVSQNRENRKIYEMQCHTLHTSVLALGGKYQWSPIWSTTITPSGISGKTHGRGRGWRGWCWCPTSDVLWGEEFHLLMRSLGCTRTFPKRISMTHRGCLISLRRAQTKFLFEHAEQLTSLEAAFISDYEYLPPEDGVDLFTDKDY